MVYSRPRSSGPRENNIHFVRGCQPGFGVIKGGVGAKGSGTKLLNADDVEVDQGGVQVHHRDAPVYFDSKHDIVFQPEMGPSYSCSTFSVQIGRVRVSNYQSANIRYRRPHP